MFCYNYYYNIFDPLSTDLFKKGRPLLKRYSAPSPEPAPKRISLFDGEVDYYGADTADAPVKGERDIPPQAMVFYDERTNDYLATKDRADEGKQPRPT
ncbi:MAG: hypothetical protein GX878_08535 [Firmicutes bacterium]|nr:hypothetical protein [Bacillota bacterium]